jgi:hypothetical protein
MRNSSRTLAATAVLSLLAAGCTSSTEPFVDPGALAAAETFDRIADSLTTAGVDAGVSSAYHELARVVRTGSGLTSVIISVDGTPAEYLATAQSFDQNYCPPRAVCALIYRPPLNSVIAWQRSDPRRIVQLTADASFPIGSVPPGALDPFLSRATLTFFDGAGGVFLGTGGTQSITVTPTDEPCVIPNQRVEAIYVMPPVSCTRADFTVSFDGTVQPPPFALRKNTATGSHTISMTAQSVSGMRLAFLFCPTCGADAPPLRPPVTISATSSVLQPTLRATASATAVTLTFTVTNTSLAPVKLDFNSGQEYDFLVRSAASGALVWQWSRDMGFTLALTSRTLAAGETATYVEHWTPTAPGAYTAQALLTSSSHRATSHAGFTVP